MKKLFYGMAALALLLPSCESDQNPALEQQEAQIDMSDFTVYTNSDIDEASRMAQSKNEQRICYTMANLNRLLYENPGLEQKMYAIEYNTRKFIAAKGKPGGGGSGGGSGGGGTTDSDNDGIPDSTDACPNVSAPGTIDGCPATYQTITIPVVFNIIEDYPDQVTSSQISSQLAILNKDFNNNNPNTSSIPNEFKNSVADFKIIFTNTIVIRKVSTKSSWGTNDAMKFSSQGGINATDPSKYLNIWVCEIGGGILGYAQFPGGPASTDGVVIGPDYFGETTSGGEYGHGRTATHEIGHWLNLRHIWGDGPCKFDDYVADTPSSDGPNYRCPTYPTVNCRSNDMTMNYMDYTYDNCMYMFTNGQNDRAHAIFELGAPRAAMAGY